jgi:SAM-dependent methyltransferase
MGEPAERDAATSCPLCGGTARRRLVTKRGWDVVRCRGCGLVYVSPPPSHEELEALYSAGDYHAALDEAERRRYFARRLRQVEALACDRTAEGGCATRRLLDVGCSKGHFLELAQASGWQAVGVELNPRAVEEARARGLDVRHGELPGLAFADASFDVVTLFDVIEHTAAPRALLAACHKALRPGGLLVVTTPDVGGLVPRVTYGLLGRGSTRRRPATSCSSRAARSARPWPSRASRPCASAPSTSPSPTAWGSSRTRLWTCWPGAIADGRRQTADGRRQTADGSPASAVCPATACRRCRGLCLACWVPRRGPQGGATRCSSPRDAGRDGSPAPESRQDAQLPPPAK